MYNVTFILLVDNIYKCICAHISYNMLLLIYANIIANSDYLMILALLYNIYNILYMAYFINVFYVDNFDNINNIYNMDNII